MAKAPNVLLIDDDEQFRNLVRPVLKSRGLDVLEAGSGTEAQNLVQKHKFDLVIVDGVLPDIDGMQWITRQRAAGNTTPMVFVSAVWQDIRTYHQLTRSLGVSQVIHKPVIPSVFGEQVMSELGQRPKYKLSEEVMVKQVDSSLQEIADEYINALPDNIAAVERALAQLKVPGDKTEAFKRARIASHKIRGTAGTFGFQKTGEAMGIIEDILRSTDGNPDLLTDGQWLQIEEAVRRAKSVLPQSVTGEVSLPNHLRPRRTTTESRPTLSRLLIVDDDPALLEFLTRIGRQRLVDVVPVSTGTDAIAKLESARFDAIIIDLQLGPETDSLKLALKIRELPGYHEIPLAFMSSDAGLYDRISIAHAGASLYLNKPIEPDSFEDAVQRLLALKKVGQATILIVDDDLLFAQHARAVLAEKGMNVHLLEDPAGILDKIHEVAPDLLLLDLLMPGITGFDICRILRTMPRWQDLPIIFVTAQIGLETRIAAYECGGDDYIPKPMADEELVSRVLLRVERAKLLRERTERDAITGLLLRRSFMERLNSMLASAKRHKQGVGLALLDIDHFKEINDSHGHLSGDSVLAGLGRLMSRRFRVEDLRGRWGGDEFILGFYASDGKSTELTTSSLVNEFHHMPFPSDSGEVFKGSISAGTASFPEDGESVYDLIRAADRRLYLAKSSGRNTVVARDEKAGET